MKASGKGALAGMFAGVAIAILWAFATTGDEGDCIAPGSSWSDGCQCEPIPGSMLALVGLFAATPAAIAFGAAMGAFAERLRDFRRTVLATIAAALAGLLVGIADLFRHCSTDPQPATLLIRALVPAVAAALVLELVTRTEPAIARAQLLRE